MRTTRAVLQQRLLWAAIGALTLFTLWQAAAGIVSRVSGQSISPREVTPRGALSPDERSTIELFEKSRSSVVYITTVQRVRDLWTRNIFEVPRGTGSGFVWDDRGHIVTNNHVVAGASQARVRLSDGRDVAASLVGVSPDHDLAVLRIAVTKPPSPLPLGTSHDLKVGQKVLAIGNPFGLDWTLTTGIISALDRSLPSEDGRTLIDHLIQTDAAINPGNSGGPLLDSAGRLIGVTTAIFSPSGAYAGVGFAVPVDTVNRVVPQLIGRGKYVRPVLGINVSDGFSRMITARLGVQGVPIMSVDPGSGAAAAGLRGVRVDDEGTITAVGDIIVAVDGRSIDSVARLLATLDERRVGDTVRLTVLRDGKKVDVTVKLQGGR